MGQIIALLIIAAMAVLLMYWFWPGRYPCKRCGTPLDMYGYCEDPTCPYSDYQQHETWTEG